MPLSISISLSEVYAALCPACREVLLDYVSGKAGSAQLRDGLRKQFEASCHSERSEESPREHS